MSDKNHMQVTPGDLSANIGNSTKSDTDLLSMAPLSGRQSRPWNPDWYIYQLLTQRHLSDLNQQILVIHCGQGDVAIRLAMLGYDVYGIDADPAHIDWAREFALRHAVTDRCNFAVMATDDIQYDDERFDVIVGIDALKQCDYATTIQQLHRILKPAGTAIFRQQVLTPIDASPVSDMALTLNELAQLSDTFEDVKTQRFTILSRLDHLIPRFSHSTRSTLEKLDRKLLDLCPPMASLGATAVISCTKHADTLTDSIQFAA